jgi:hypothetical protein
MADLDALADGLTRSLDELRDIVGIATPAASGVPPLSPATI